MLNNTWSRYWPPSTVVHRSVVIYGPVKLGKNCRVDAGVVITATPEHPVEIGDHVHIGAYAALFGSAGGIKIQSYAGISARVSIFSGTDDYSSGVMSNPTIPDKYRRVKSGLVFIERHVLVGAHSVVMPGVNLGYGASVGALSLVNRSVPPGMVVSGNPIRKIGNRDLEKLMELEQQFEAEHGKRKDF